MAGTIDEHLAWCEKRGLRASYITEMSYTLRRLERAIGPAETLTSTQLEGWWDDLAVSAGARATYAAHLGSFYRWLQLYRRRDDNPTERLIRPRQRRRLPRPIADDRLRKALAAAEPPVSVWLALACYMGFRACEIADLHREDVSGDVVIVRDGKGGKQRIVPLHPQVAPMLDRLPLAGPLFSNAYGGRLRANTVSQRANRHLHSLDIPESIHQLRHWFGTNIYRGSRDLRLTQELMGHSSPLTTAGYAAWSPEAAVGAVNALTLEDEEVA